MLDLCGPSLTLVKLATRRKPGVWHRLAAVPCIRPTKRAFDDSGSVEDDRMLGARSRAVIAF